MATGYAAASDKDIFVTTDLTMLANLKKPALVASEVAAVAVDANLVDGVTALERAPRTATVTNRTHFGKSDPVGVASGSS